jgi:hypothetical protein
MKKIDILNFITNFRKAPNTVKTYKDILLNSGVSDETKLNQFLGELKQIGTIKEVELDGERAFQVTHK